MRRVRAQRAVLPREDDVMSDPISQFFKEFNNNDIEIKLNLKNYLKKN